MDPVTLNAAKAYHDAHSGSGLDCIISWNGLAAPDVTKIPAGVTVTYQGTTYTGTLVASVSTKNKLYFVKAPDGVTPNAYAEYMTAQEGNSYFWEGMGTTEMDLTDYPTYEDVVTTSKNGVMSTADKVKLNGIQTGAITLTERVAGQSYSSGVFTYVKES